MQDLDEKLEEILEDTFETAEHIDLSDCLSQLKQAFTNAGYFKPPDDYLEVRPLGDGDKSKLEEKLEQILGLYRREIERNHGGRTVGKTLTEEEAVVQIKQAFENAGLHGPTDRVNMKSVCEGLGSMTGQEWYDRFYKELMLYFDEDGDYPKHLDGYSTVGIINAARAAAGIE